METSAAILAILNSLPDQQITGKKRLQKIVFLLKENGLDCDAEFELRNYGPFSVGVARSTETLAFTGQIDEADAEVSFHPRLFTTIYKLDKDQAKIEEELPQEQVEFLLNIEKFKTVELEIAATARLFMSTGLRRNEAIAATKKMKPSKSTDRVLVEADKVLDLLPE